MELEDEVFGLDILLGYIFGKPCKVWSKRFLVRFHCLCNWCHLKAASQVMCQLPGIIEQNFIRAYLDQQRWKAPKICQLG